MGSDWAIPTPQGPPSLKGGPDQNVEQKIFAQESSHEKVKLKHYTAKLCDRIKMFDAKTFINHYHDSFEIFHVPEAWSLDIEKLIGKFLSTPVRHEQISYECFAATSFTSIEVAQIENCGKNRRRTQPRERQRKNPWVRVKFGIFR